jgi:hypothetical protein
MSVCEASPIQVFLEVLRRYPAKFPHPGLQIAGEGVHILNMERAMFHPLPASCDKPPMRHAMLMRERFVISVAVRAKHTVFGDGFLQDFVDFCLRMRLQAADDSCAGPVARNEHRSQPPFLRRTDCWCSSPECRAIPLSRAFVLLTEERFVCLDYSRQAISLSVCQRISKFMPPMQRRVLCDFAVDRRFAHGHLRSQREYMFQPKISTLQPR